MTITDSYSIFTKKYYQYQNTTLPDKDSKEWEQFNDELGERMRGVGIVFEKYCKFKPDIGEGVHLLDD